jgi:dTDP-4-amino-4,6-dideoxygalactose transaminase
MERTGSADASRTVKDVDAGPGLLNFNRPHVTGREFEYLEQAVANLHLSGNGPYSDRCSEWLGRHTGSARALLTPSCTAALEMAVILAGVEPGDEVVMPSFTFVSTANAVVLRGGVPVFADVREDTLNLDPEAAADAITDRTRALMPVHYAGVGCDMEPILAMAGDAGARVIEDAAQGICSTRDGRPLGGIGDLGALSFHETKNVSCGEGGALLVNDESLVERAEILQEKGTNRSAFYRGQTDKYTWVDVGSSYLMSEVNAAYLFAQLEDADAITRARMEIWEAYHARFAELEERGAVRRPIVPAGCEHNAHMYYLLARDEAERDAVIAHLAARSIQAVFHYVPLHSSPAGQRYGRAAGSLARTESAAGRLLRLPLWVGMTEDDVDRVATEVEAALA